MAENSLTRKRYKLYSRVRRDRLTGLYSRDYFLERTQSMIRNHADQPFALIRLDIDRFRLYNAAFGKEAGDALLKSFAAAIIAEVANVSPCTYGRIESDVFALCVPYHQDALLQRIQHASTKAHFFCENYRLKLSFGIYVLTSAEQNIEEAYSYASEAAKKCKGTVNHCVFYDEAMYRRQQTEQRIMNDMKRALAEHQFQVYLQPKYSLEPNTPCGAEALVRWLHPTDGMISPGDFIPVFEQNGFIYQLDYYMWEQVCILLYRWMTAGLQVYPISVNVSRISLYHPYIIDDLIELTNRYQIPRYLLNLEITESAYMSDPDLMKSIIDQLRSSGFVLMMDDFGSGYSSLNTLKDIEMDILKIDMKFLPSGQNHAKSEKILASVIRMAGWIGMPVVVEGVETEEQRDFLASISCGYVQGYYFARPMPAEEYETRILTSRAPLTPSAFPSKMELSDIDAIWTLDTMNGDLLKSVAVPVAILEYSLTGVDLLRRNPAYTRVFGNQPDSFTATLSLREREKVHIALTKAASEKNADCDCMSIFPDGSCRWFRLHLQLIHPTAHSDLLCVTFQDITREQCLQTGLDKFFNILKAPYQEDTQLLRRIKNLLTQSDQFQLWMEDYKEIDRIGQIPKNDLADQICTIPEIKLMITFMQHVFDFVRVVDPVQMKTLEFEEGNLINSVPYTCFKLWGRNARCENCSSLCSLQGHRQITKYEVIENDIFYVISQPLYVVREDGSELPCVIELVSHISDHAMIKELQGQSIDNLLEDMQNKIYTDPLTGAYNRRYYDEMLFLYHGKKKATSKVGLILLDMNKFKRTNDMFGHAEGDRILIGVTQELKKHVRDEDSVIRYGGDEFLVVITDCEEAQLTAEIERLRIAVTNVRFGPKNTIRASADFGYAYTACFEKNSAFLEALFQQADERMYENKKNNSLEYQQLKDQ